MPIRTDAVADHSLRAPPLARRGTARSRAPTRPAQRRPRPRAASGAAAAMATSEPEANSDTCARALGGVTARRRRVAQTVFRRVAGAQLRQVLPGQRQHATARCGLRARAPSIPPSRSVSAGRNTSRLGIARSAARCSTGWWVGPSSPRPIEFVGHHDRSPACPSAPPAGSTARHVIGEDQEGAAE